MTTYMPVQNTADDNAALRPTQVSHCLYTHTYTHTPRYMTCRFVRRTTRALELEALKS